MHRREFVKRSRSSRLGGEKKNRREKPRCTALPVFFPLSFRKLSAGRLGVVQRPTRARFRRSRGDSGGTRIFLPSHQPQFFSPPRGGDYSRNSLSFSSSSPSPPAVCDDTIVRCSLQQRVFDFSSRSFNGCNRGWILAYRKGNFKRSPFRSHCRR